jgi:hypothetical protein
MEPIFVFGNLMDDNVQFAAFGRRAEFVFDTLFDYKKEGIRIHGETSSNLVPARGHSVAGSILYLQPEEVKILENKFGPAYQKIRVKLYSGKEAWTYLLK